MSDSHSSTLIIVRGIPGSGKTHIAAALYEALHDPTIVMLDPDATDYSSQAYIEHVRQQTEEGVDKKLHAYRFLRAQAYAGISSGRLIIWNQPFTNLEIFNKMMANMKKQAAEYHIDLRVLVVEVEIDSTVAAERVIARKQKGGHGPSDATFERFVNDYVSFAAHGYDTVQVNGDDPVEGSVQAIAAKLN